MIIYFIIKLIKTYQTCLSPLFGYSCKFTPTCSQYMIDSIKSKGVIIGTVKGLWRLLRCNPFSEAKYDPAD